jgi:hypothetical protein
MKSFMTLGSLSRGMEVDKVPAKDDMAPFPREDAAMTIYDMCLSPEMCRMPDPSLGTPAHCGRGCGNAGMYGHEFCCTLTYVKVYIYVHYIHANSEKEEKGEREKQQVKWPEVVVALKGLSVRLASWH